MCLSCSIFSRVNITACVCVCVHENDILVVHCSRAEWLVSVGGRSVGRSVSGRDVAEIVSCLEWGNLFNERTRARARTPEYLCA